MRKLPEFTKKEIEYLYGVICKSPTELISEKGMPWKSFTPFKNALLNKVKKYEHVLEEMTRLQCKREPIEKKGVTNG